MSTADEAVLDARGLSSCMGAAFVQARASSRGQSLPPVRLIVFALQIAADFAAIALSVVLSGLIARAISVQYFQTEYLGFETAALGDRVLLWSLMAGVVCGWFCLTGHYTLRRPLHEDTKRTTAVLAVIFLLDGYIEFATKTQFSRLWILLVWPLAMLMVPLARIVIHRVLDFLGWWRVGVLVLGSGQHGQSMDSLLQRDRYVGYVKTGHSSLLPELSDPDNTVSEKLKHEMQRSCAKFVIVAPSEEEFRYFAPVADVLNQNLIPYYLVPPIQKLPLYGLSIRTMFSSDAVFLSYRSGLMSPVRQVLKRFLDLVVSAVLLVLLLPLFVVISLVIAADGGAPIFGHRRIGCQGRTFNCLKFRSMQRNADRVLAELLAKNPEIARQWYANFKLDSDPRITRVGRFLRKTSLDELPQLINVLRGEMSLVGPRPVVADELERYYGKDVFYYKLVRPGMTGLWQISGRSSTTYERRVFLDSWYVRNWTLWTDLVIFFNTVPSVLSRDGAV